MIENCVYKELVACQIFPYHHRGKVEILFPLSTLCDILGMA